MDYKLIFETIIKFKNETIIVVDKNANIVYFKEPKANFFKEDSEKEVLGKNILNLLEDFTEEESTFYRVLRTKEPIFDHIQTFITYAKKKVTAVSTTFPLIDNGNIVGALEILSDINDFSKLHKKIIYESQKEDFLKSNNKILAEKNNGAIYTINDIIGESNFMKELKSKIYKIADSSSPVMVYGETGTGKELVVQAIHNASLKRREKPFIAQNCAAIPKNLLESILFGTASGSFTGSKEKPGLFELADGGTLLLDEINSMDLDLQAKLLRVLQTGEIRRVGGNKTIKLDVRIMSTSNVDPLVAVEKGLLRQDLYYRLNVISFRVCPLRERKEDIELLLNYFIDNYNNVLNKSICGVSEACKKYLLSYDWPGNIRELRYSVENMMNFIDSDVIDVDDLPENIKKSDGSNFAKTSCDNIVVKPLKETLQLVEVDMIKRALMITAGNQAKAAKLLEIPRQTLYNKILKYNIRGSYTFD